MVGKQRTEGDRFEFGAIALANLLPVVGYFLFDWDYAAVFMLYWLDLVALWLVYCGFALFAQQRSHYEEREQPVLIKPLGGDFWGNTPRKIGPLPPIYPRNLRVIIPSCVFIMFAIFVGGAALLEGTTDGGMPGSTTGDLLAFLANFSVFTSAPIFAAALLFIVIHIVTAYRIYIRSQQYEEISAYIILELPARFILVYVCGLMLLVFVFLIGLLIAEFVGSDTFAAVLPYVLFVTLKLTLERGRFHAERSAPADGFPSWFLPDPPQSEQT
ncbi:DUF6498-containing protein [Halobiforma nitratireducens]|uniref:Uncharacterized protein n=1 Tax=Halobiforma nitratireducens JCM 10879 TaxID=1227454 RepID=M0L8F7_9EURY|nr:DUF6498-containing protein [Halobiforma nitratireducens]EMA29363.1 hypothetical protein C446_17254 [Halobiforma nitratireducens JCM 10879]